MDAGKKIGEAGRKAEKSIAQRLRADLTLSSGAMAGNKGDMTIDRKAWKFLMEAKSTSSESMSLKMSWLAKIQHEAISQDKTPAIAINFTNDHGLSVMAGRWVAIPEGVFRELIGDH